MIREALRLLRFNEAGAVMPRKVICPTLPRATGISFNEAGAVMPRKGFVIAALPFATCSLQ